MTVFTTFKVKGQNVKKPSFYINKIIVFINTLQKSENAIATQAHPVSYGIHGL